MSAIERWPPPDILPHNPVLRVSSRPAHDKDDIRGVGIQSGRDRMRREGLYDRILDDTAQLKRRRLKIGSSADFDGKAKTLCWQPVVRQESRQQIIEKRFKPNSIARPQIPGNTRRCPVIAPGDPRQTGVEWIEQRRFALALGLVDANIERRAHDETLKFRLHHAVCASGTRQAQLIKLRQAHRIVFRRTKLR